MTIGQKVDALRKALGMSQREVSEETGGEISREGIARIVKDRGNALERLGTRKALARAFGLDLAMLSSYLDGDAPLISLVAASTRKKPETAGGWVPHKKQVRSTLDRGKMNLISDGAVSGLVNLDAVIIVHGDRWTDWTKGLAKRGFFGWRDVTPKEWEERLDRLDGLLQEAQPDPPRDRSYRPS